MSRELASQVNTSLWGQNELHNDYSVLGHKVLKYFLKEQILFTCIFRRTKFCLSFPKMLSFSTTENNDIIFGATQTNFWSFVFHPSFKSEEISC